MLRTRPPGPTHRLDHSRFMVQEHAGGVRKTLSTMAMAMYDLACKHSTIIALSDMIMIMAMDDMTVSWWPADSFVVHFHPRSNPLIIHLTSI